jgi:hypothetical protein
LNSVLNAENWLRFFEKPPIIVAICCLLYAIVVLFTRRELIVAPRYRMLVAGIASCKMEIGQAKLRMTRLENSSAVDSLEELGSPSTNLAG